MNGHRSPKSGEVYNQRHVREATNQAVRKLQQDLMDRSRLTKVADDE